MTISWGGKNLPWTDSRVIGCFVGGFALLVIFMVWEHWAKDPLMPPAFLRNRAIVAIFFAEFFYGANLLGMMYYVPQFFQMVYGDSATISGVALPPMMLGLTIGNPIAGWATSKYGFSLLNAFVGAVLTVLISGLITGMVIFVQTVGDIFGIAIYAALYQNELRAKLNQLDLSAEQIGAILADVQKVKMEFSGRLYDAIVEVYARRFEEWVVVVVCLFGGFVG